MTFTEDGLIADRQEQREEAAKRMRYLELPQAVIEDFKRGALWVSLPTKKLVKLGADRNEAILSEIREYEDRWNCTLYHVVRTASAFGVMDSCLMVSEYADEWAEDWEDLMDGYAIAQVFNRTYPELSEAGTIGYKQTEHGSLLRAE